MQHIPPAFDFVIVLCPNVSYELGEFEECDTDGVYIGGPIRMQAAIDLYQNLGGTVQHYIVVGGGLDAEPTNRWKKTDNMQRFLRQKGIPKHKLSSVASGADTLGNLRAIWVTHHHLFKNKTVGILSNSYHLPRAMRIVNDPQFEWNNTHFFALQAEELATTEDVTRTEKDPSFAERLKREKQGMLDWYNGTYTRQFLPVHKWRGELLQIPLET